MRSVSLRYDGVDMEVMIKKLISVLSHEKVEFFVFSLNPPRFAIHLFFIYNFICYVHHNHTHRKNKYTLQFSSLIVKLMRAILMIIGHERIFVNFFFVALKVS
jgi:hypothetical protein